MTDLSIGVGLSPLERTRLAAELLQVRQQLAAGALNPLEKVRASARGLELRARLGAPSPVTDPLQAELEASRANMGKYEHLISRGALTKDVLAAMDRHSAAFQAVEDAKVAAAWEAGKARPIGTANNKPHTIKAADALTPAGAIKADSSNSKADSAIWYYQGDIQQLSFTASIKIEGQAAAGAERAKAILAGLKAAKARGFKLRNLRAGRLGTVWVLETGDGGAYLTRAGFEDATNPVFNRPDMPEPVPGYESMLAQQTVLATAFIAWLDTLGYEQRHNQGVVSRKISSTAVGDWVRLDKDTVGLFLQYRTPGTHTGVRITGKDFDALITECRRLANAPEVEPAPENNPESLPDTTAEVSAADPEIIEPDQDPRRSPAGGTIGLNGEFYKGGTILPTTTLPKGASSTRTAGTGRQLIEPGVYADPPSPGAMALFGSRREFLVQSNAGLSLDETKREAAVYQYGEQGPALIRATAREYNAGRRWVLPGESIDPTEADQAPPAASAPEIIEYKTKSTGKVLRGVIRMDLSRDEAKAIDPHTWRMNGGYFIREKYLEGDTSAVQAAPAPVVLSAEQQAEQQARDERQAQERQQQTLASQVSKLRAVADKAIADGTQSMNQDRLTNTSRRAGMAAAAIAQASVVEAEGRTLSSIADALEVGAAGPLEKLTSRAQLQELKSALNLAIYESDKGLSYTEQRNMRGRAANESDLQRITFPVPLAWSRRFKDAALTIAKRQAQGNSRLIAALTKLSNNQERFRLTADADIAITRKAHKLLQSLGEGYTLKDTMDGLARVERLNRMGITSTVELQDACRALLPHLAARKEESAVAKAERAIIGQKVGIDFFPTPAHLAQRMAKLARISKGDRVLEPSAGNGNLADAAAAAGASVDVIEISSQLRDILTAKGYTVVDHDFMGFTPEQPYSKILMNPPFGNRKDCEHIMRAFGMLAGGGSLVAIAGEGVFFGQDQKAQQFRDWLDKHGAEVEALEGGTFQDNKLLAQTGANARLIVLRK